MTSQGTAHGRSERAIASRNLLTAETAAREMGGLSLSDALSLSLAAAALAELRHGQRAVGVEALKRVLRR
jgi:hypothetical protein